MGAEERNAGAAAKGQRIITERKNIMNPETSFYPELPESGRAEAQKLIDKFKVKLKSAAEDAITELYCDILPYIESDSWTNFRVKLLNDFKDYKNKVHAEHDFREIRKKIYDENKDEIIKDLNQDLVLEMESLKKTIEDLQRYR